MCRLLGVTRSGYYGYVKRQRDRPEDPVHRAKLDTVVEIAKASDFTYGSRRVKRAVNTLGYAVSRNKARQLMREAGVEAKSRKKYKITTNSNYAHSVFENKLNREFEVAVPNQAYAGDITYLWTQEGWLSLAVVTDLYSRKVVRWSMSSRMKAQLVCDALRMAIWQRRPEAGLICHSDRGSQ